MVGVLKQLPRFVALQFFGIILLFQIVLHSSNTGFAVVAGLPATTADNSPEVDQQEDHSDLAQHQQSELEDHEEKAPPPGVGLPKVCRNENDENGGVHIANPHVAALVETSKYQSSCRCTESNTVDKIANFDPSSMASASSVSDMINMFNELIASLSVNIQWSCRNACATCFPSGDCAVIEVEYQGNYNGVEGGFSLSGFMSLMGAGEAGMSQFLTGGQSMRICTEFTVGSTGTVCFEDAGVDALTNLQSNGDLGGSEDRPCVLEYNQEACASCTITSTGCIVADCSNFGVVQMIDTCQNEESLSDNARLFQILPYYSGARSASALSVGPCQEQAHTPLPDVESPTTAADEL